MVKFDGIGYKSVFQGNASVVDFLIEVVLVPKKIRNREFCQLFLDGKFYFHISFVIGSE